MLYLFVELEVFDLFELPLLELLFVVFLFVLPLPDVLDDVDLLEELLLGVLEPMFSPEELPADGLAVVLGEVEFPGTEDALGADVVLGEDSDALPPIYSSSPLALGLAVAFALSIATLSEKSYTSSEDFIT